MSTSRFQFAFEIGYYLGSELVYFISISTWAYATIVHSMEKNESFIQHKTLIRQKQNIVHTESWTSLMLSENSVIMSIPRFYWLIS